MSMQNSPYMVLWRTVQGQDVKDRKIDRGTLRRIVVFARPHKTRLTVFLVISVLTALLGVVTPILAGDVVRAINAGDAVSVVVWLAVAIAAVAVVDAGLSILNRWLSSLIGEGLILDLRTAVYDHVQRMPIAFFSRTRTGALVSRLNNDVIGAQRAFSTTLSGVVGNVVTLVLTTVLYRPVLALTGGAPPERLLELARCSTPRGARLELFTLHADASAPLDGAEPLLAGGAAAEGAGRLVLPGGETVPLPDAVGGRLQQSGPAGSFAVVATPTSLIKQPLGGGDAVVTVADARLSAYSGPAWTAAVAMALGEVYGHA